MSGQNQAEDADTQAVTSDLRIFGYLKEIKQQHIPLTIKPLQGDTVTPFEATLLQVGDQYLVLHQLLPPEWLEQYPEASLDVLVSCSTHYGALRFHSRLSVIGDEPGSDAPSHCRLDLPARITRSQLRSHFRVPLLRYETAIALSLPNGARLEGRLEDISLGGCLCLMKMHDSQDLHQGQLIDDFSLTIQGLLDLRCTAILCRISPPDENLQYWRLGLRFIKLDSEQSATLRKAIFQLERLNIRKTSY